MDEQYDSGIEAGERSRTGAARRVLGAVVGIVLVLVLALAAVRVFVPTIPPDQAVPEGHFGEPCIACHFVIEGAEEVEVE